MAFFVFAFVFGRVVGTIESIGKSCAVREDTWEHRQRTSTQSTMIDSLNAF